MSCNHDPYGDRVCPKCVIALGEVCPHGSLKRQCLICERDEEITALRQQLAVSERQYYAAFGELEATKQQLTEARERAAKWQELAMCDTLKLFAPYLKDGETPIERLERERNDNNTLMGLLAQRTDERAALRQQLADMEQQRDNEATNALLLQNRLSRQIEGNQELKAQLAAAQPVIAAACAIIDYQQTGQPHYPEWEWYYDALDDAVVAWRGKEAK